MRMLAGLRSRWMTECSCKYLYPLINCLTIMKTSASGSFFLFSKTSSREPLSQSSWNRQMLLEDFLTSQSSTMFSFLMAFIISIQFLRDSQNFSGSFLILAVEIVFTAIRFPFRISAPLQTSPYEPLPIFSFMLIMKGYTNLQQDVPSLAAYSLILAILFLSIFYDIHTYQLQSSKKSTKFKIETQIQHPTNSLKKTKTHFSQFILETVLLYTYYKFTQTKYSVDQLQIIVRGTMKECENQDKWFLQYGTMNGRQTVTLKAGLSAEICFAKYVAFKRNYFYKGYERKAPDITPNFIEQTLGYIYSEVKSHSNIGKTVIYSPGVCSVPYLVQTANMIYLPSHLLVGVTVIEDLVQMLDQAYIKGYRCYAVIGYDAFFKDRLCAWIKFSQPPKQYISLIKELNIQDIIFMSCHDVKGTNHGAQRKARLIGGQHIDEIRKQPKAKDIFTIFLNEQNNGNYQSDIHIFKKLIKDKPTSFWRQISAKPTCSYIHDWQSGIDCIETLQQNFKLHLEGLKVNFYYVLSQDSWKLYLLAYYLGKEFIQNNQEKSARKAKGIVFNQYFMNNPTYELNYGYIPILYWQFYSKNEERILKTISEEEKQLPRWFNMHEKSSINLIQNNSVVIKTNHEGLELANWITKYAPKEYKLTYLTMQQVINCLKKHRLLYKQGISIIE